MNKIVLGTSRICFKSQLQANKLFDAAFRAGISIFDTAPSYGDSDKKISVWKSQRSSSIDLQVTTKLGLKEMSTTTTLKNSIDSIYNDFGFENIHTLFIHSVSLSELNEKVLHELVFLRDAGYIPRIGYSGDGRHLQLAMGTGFFDSIMCTINPIDNSNLRILRKKDYKLEVFAKRTMANYAWTLKNYAKMRFLRRHNWVLEEYRTRIQKYMPDTPRHDMAFEFLKYGLTSCDIDYSVIGISSVSHLNKLLDNLKKSTVVKTVSRILKL